MRRDLLCTERFTIAEVLHADRERLLGFDQVGSAGMTRTRRPVSSPWWTPAWTGGQKVWLN